MQDRKRLEQLSRALTSEVKDAHSELLVLLIQAKTHLRTRRALNDPCADAETLMATAERKIAQGMAALLAAVNLMGQG